MRSSPSRRQRAAHAGAAGPTGLSTNGRPAASTNGQSAAPLSTEYDRDLGWVASLLAERRDDILDRWVEAATRQPFHYGRRELAVSNNLGNLYDALVALLRKAPGTVDHGS